MVRDDDLARYRGMYWQQTKRWNQVRRGHDVSQPIPATPRTTRRAMMDGVGDNRRVPGPTGVCSRYNRRNGLT